MSAVAIIPRPLAPSIAPRPKLWTCAEFHRLGDLGLFEGRRAMMIDGVIPEQGPMNPPHALALELVDGAIRRAFAAGWRVRVQLPLDLSQTIDPSPDLAVVKGDPRASFAHPTRASLVVEVADPSLDFDTTDKASLYAAGGIADYWVLDVAGRKLLVHRDPKPDTTHKHGYGYVSVSTFAVGQSVAPLAVPPSAVAVADLLP